MSFEYCYPPKKNERMNNNNKNQGKATKTKEGKVECSPFNAEYTIVVFDSKMEREMKVHTKFTVGISSSFHS